MPKRAITQLFVERITPPKTGRVEYWDAHQPGMFLRVSSTGAMAWGVMFRVRGKQVRETLGTLDAVPKVDAARELALASLKKARSGINPVEERRVAAVRAAADTVGAAIDRYLVHCGRNLRASTVRGYRQVFEHDIRPRWGSRPLSEITRADVLELMHDKAGGRARKRTGAPPGAGIQANRVLTRLRTFFGWCIAQNLIAPAGDPTIGLRKPNREKPRDRVLTDEEIRVFWTATEVLDAKRKDAVPFGAIFRLLLLTAQRETEVAGLRWSEIHDDVWETPGARTKNGKPHFVHLSDFALEVLGSVPPVKGRDLLFSGNGKTPTSGFGRAKTRLDRAMLKVLRAERGEQAELPPWVIHDLRRTATTGMARLGIAPHVAHRVLNHIAGTIRGVAAVYNRFEYLEERKAALQAWGHFVEQLVRPSADNVVPLREVVA